MGTVTARTALSALDQRMRLFLRDNFVYGTEGPRRVYLNARMMVNAFDVVRRRRSARTLLPEPHLTIDDSTGYRILPPGDAVVDAAQERCARLGLSDLSGVYLEDFAAAAENAGHVWMISGGRITRLLDRAALTHESPFLRFALDPDLLAAVSGYLGVVPILSAMDIWNSLPSRDLRGPQRYHCDWADDRQVRVFVYATDVTQNDGPLQVIDARQSQAVRRAINYHFDGRGPAFQSDEAITDSTGDIDSHSIVGPRGTIALLDTCRCFHCGSRLQLGSQPRVVAMFQYSRPGSFFLSAKYRKLAPFLELAGSPGLTYLQRQVLGAD